MVFDETLPNLISILSPTHSLIPPTNNDSQTSTGTIETGFGLCLAFVSGDRHVILGTKTGALQLLNIASSEVMETLEDAHDGSVWSIAMRPDRT